MHSKNVVLEIIYTTACNIYLLLEFFYNLWVYLNHKIVDYFQTNTAKNELEYVVKNTEKLNKLPKHLTVLLADETPSYQDLANLIMWSVASGISFVSFFDEKGILKNTELRLQEAVNKKKTDDESIVWGCGENSLKNGIAAKRKIYVRTLSGMDGRQQMTDIAKQLSDIKVNSIDQEIVENNLKDFYGFPDPDLGFCCTNVFTVFGYPPWQIRTTEFFCIGTHHGFTPNKFVDALYRFSTTEQRLGK